MTADVRGSRAAGGPVPTDEEVLARAAWSRLAEPGDPVAGALVGTLGPVDALAWVRAAGDESDVGLHGVGPLSARAAARLDAAVARWAPRLADLAPERDVASLERRGGRLLVPGSAHWPEALDDLGHTAPHALWVLGRPEALTGAQGAGTGHLAAVIGARAATAYGERVAAEITAGLGDAGVTVVSGGAYGIDAVAHRAALAGDRPTVAVLAGGVDRLYPAGNARLLTGITQDGALVSEVPPGAVPSRSRFLQRNRLIAALASATVVVEAAWRSGTLSTAAHAARLLRPVGAVPGPVTSVQSAGCHRLLREGAAVCVTDAAEALELLEQLGTRVAERAVQEVDRGRRHDGLDDLSPELRAVLEAVPVRGGSTVERVARVAGRSLVEVRAALGRLELEGRVVRDADRWSRRRSA